MGILRAHTGAIGLNIGLVHSGSRPFTLGLSQHRRNRCTENSCDGLVGFQLGATDLCTSLQTHTPLLRYPFPHKQ